MRSEELMGFRCASAAACLVAVALGRAATASEVFLEAVDSVVVAEALRVSYTVKNKSSGDIFLINRLFNWGSTDFPTPVKDKAYTSLRQGVLEVKKAAPEIPDGTVVEWPEVPYLTRVRPGGSFSETFSLSLPISGSQPYGNVLEGNDSARRIRLVIGWLSGITPRQLETPAGSVLTAQPDFVIATQQLLHAEVELAVATKMRDRSP